MRHESVSPATVEPGVPAAIAATADVQSGYAAEIPVVTQVASYAGQKVGAAGTGAVRIGYGPAPKPPEQ